MNRNDKLRFIFETFGYTHQVEKLKEEQNEVIQALTFPKNPENKKEEITEEIADNFVILLQFMILFGIDKRDIYRFVNLKINRTIKRIAEKEELK